MNYNYVNAPLPFQGQKRNFLKAFKKVLDNTPSNAIYIDLFGGSGLLSHTVKIRHPDATVIYNDYDNYSKRLANIDSTNILLTDIKEIVKNSEPEIKLTKEYKQAILDRISKENGYVDFITVSSSLLFSMNYANSFEELQKQTFYNNVKKKTYNSEGYLKDVTVVSSDYMDLFECYKDKENVIFIIDPPYLSTDTSTYKNTDYWKLSDYLNILKTLEDTNYFYFTSEKSQLLELTSWLDENQYAKNPFQGATVNEIQSSVSKGKFYKDIMIYKIV